jgi:hypothetical protein
MKRVYRFWRRANEFFTRRVAKELRTLANRSLLPTEPPVAVMESAVEWCLRGGYVPSKNECRPIVAVYASKDDELNMPGETRDIWHVFFILNRFEKP